MVLVKLGGWVALKLEKLVDVENGRSFHFPVPKIAFGTYGIRMEFFMVVPYNRQR